MLTPPLTREFLRCLDLTYHAQLVLEKLKSEASDYGLEESRWRRQDAELRTRLANLERCLGTPGDPEREETYWRLVQEARAQIKSLGEKPPPSKTTPMDIEQVTEFLENLDSNWKRYPSRLRNRLLIMLIDRVELRHDRGNIEATIVWKAGFRQVVNIQRNQSHFNQEKRWREEETKLLRMLWPSASWEVILAALPERNKSSIAIRAARLRLSRQGMRKSPEKSIVWTQAEIDQMKECYLTKGLSIIEIADRLGRTEQAIEAKISALRFKRPRELRRYKQQPVWEADNFKVMRAVSTQTRRQP